MAQDSCENPFTSYPNAAQQLIIDMCCDTISQSDTLAIQKILFEGVWLVSMVALLLF